LAVKLFFYDSLLNSFTAFAFTQKLCGSASPFLDGNHSFRVPEGLPPRSRTARPAHEKSATATQVFFLRHFQIAVNQRRIHEIPDTDRQRQDSECRRGHRFRLTDNPGNQPEHEDEA
jgi:hypothetical protein